MSDSANEKRRFINPTPQDLAGINVLIENENTTVRPGKPSVALPHRGPSHKRPTKEALYGILASFEQELPKKSGE